MNRSLSSYGVRQTALHSELYLLFKDAQKPLSSKNLSLLVECSFNPASLYRAINRFLQVGIIKVVRVDEKNGAYYSLATIHQHFIICTECGQTQQLETCSIGPMIKKAQALGFTKLEHRLEIKGECSQCA